MGQSHRSSQYSGSCMTLDSNTSNTSSLAGWLEGIGLGHYRERLQQNGYTTLENIVSMSRRWVFSEIGLLSLFSKYSPTEHSASAHPDFQPTYLIRIIISFFSVIYKIWALSRHQSRNIYSIKLEYCIHKKLHVQWDTLNDVKCHLREVLLLAYNCNNICIFNLFPRDCQKSCTGYFIFLFCSRGIPVHVVPAQPVIILHDDSSIKYSNWKSCGSILFISCST